MRENHNAFFPRLLQDRGLQLLCAQLDRPGRMNARDDQRVPALLERAVDAIEIRNAELSDPEIAKAKQAVLEDDGSHALPDYTVCRTLRIDATTYRYSHNSDHRLRP